MHPTAECGMTEEGGDSDSDRQGSRPICTSVCPWAGPFTSLSFHFLT